MRLYRYTNIKAQIEIYISKASFHDTTAVRVVIGYPSRRAAALTLSAPGPAGPERNDLVVDAALNPNKQTNKDQKDPRNPTQQCRAPKLGKPKMM